MRSVGAFFGFDSVPSRVWSPRKRKVFPYTNDMKVD